MLHMKEIHEERCWALQSSTEAILGFGEGARISLTGSAATARKPTEPEMDVSKGVGCSDSP